MRELRTQSAGRPLRTLYAFDPLRTAVLLFGGDKTGDDRWYEKAVPLADRLYDQHLKRTEERRENLMPTRKFRELVKAMPGARQQKIASRVRESLAAMPLDELRKARQMTQAKLADALGVNQGEVSKIEHRTDIYLSTLAGYVEALGGKLEIRAVFPDREMRITQFEELQ
jgi:DNA-binding XRE family transcriptional regulator